jgi:hypothetical protein
LIPDEVTEFSFNSHTLPSLIMALGLTQPLTKMGTGIFLGGKEWLMHKADNLTVTCQPTV